MQEIRLEGADIEDCKRINTGIVLIWIGTQLLYVTFEELISVPTFVDRARHPAGMQSRLQDGPCAALFDRNRNNGNYVPFRFWFDENSVECRRWAATKIVGGVVEDELHRRLSEDILKQGQGEVAQAWGVWAKLFFGGH